MDSKEDILAYTNALSVDAIPAVASVVDMSSVPVPYCEAKPLPTAVETTDGKDSKKVYPTAEEGTLCVQPEEEV